MNKSDIILVFTALLLAFSFRCYKENGECSTLSTQPSADIADINQTIGNIQRQAIATTGLTKPRQAGPPMPKSYPVKTPPKKN
ncbi:hypothetical protein CAEBREN_17633 [Caenorhabditis brenneri]|uniref:Uncharacterized protein n=1 Tax=Caenorhabditis brenneri TaxID=135651 RepID=G0M7N9_CAEBE|nr:hypothetical protein CAEBREN_17633 [Caenorhabditis brenneri]